MAYGTSVILGVRQIAVSLAIVLLPVSTAVSDDRIDGSYFAVVVSDINVSVDWYKSVLQLDEVTRFHEAGRYEIVNLKQDGLFVELLQLDGANDRPEGRIEGPFKVGMLVSDLSAFIASLPGVVSPPDIVSDDRNGLLLIQLRDPDDNIIQVMEVTSGDEDRAMP